jgi:hypothetical protein
MISLQPSGAAQLINYIHRNPVRAGLVDSPRGSEWTSHRAYLGVERCPPWLERGRGLELSEFESGRALAEWVEMTPVGRRDVDAVRSLPYVPRGRPREGTS